MPGITDQTYPTGNIITGNLAWGQRYLECRYMQPHSQTRAFRAGWICGLTAARLANRIQRCRP